MISSLTGKRILLISPQSWHKVWVSKHHYALCLSKMGNIVYFLNPPDPGIDGISITDSEWHHLKIVSFKPFFPISIRFRSMYLYNLLMKMQIRKLLQKIGDKFDIVWCFDPNLYTDLGIFRAPLKIFHAVDYFEHVSAFKTATSADVIIGVSPSILDTFSSLMKPSLLIGHGLGEEFVKLANSELVEFKVTSIVSRRKVGYIGNLLIPTLDRVLLKDIILGCPEVDFYLIGPYQDDHSSLGSGDEKVGSFISFLKQQSNVHLLGPLGAKDLVNEMKFMDAFLVVYMTKMKGYDFSDTHKMLEYLSTGKPVISTPIKAYLGKTDIISMPIGISYEQYSSFFISEIERLMDLSSEELRLKRIELALSNSYQSQIQRIEQLLNDKVFYN